ncbi:MAG: hypothetical protein ACRDU5_11455 [Mycobacterium sp.]
MTGRPLVRWQRNVIGAVVVAAAVGVLVVTGLGPAWSAYRHTVVPETVVPAGQSGTAGGQNWKLGSIRHLNRSPVNYGPALPTGTVLTVVTIDRSGPITDEMCVGVITDGDRRWNAEGVGGFRPPQADGLTTMCNKPGRLQLTFLLPHDVVPTAIDVTTLDGQITVRMLV